MMSSKHHFAETVLDTLFYLLNEKRITKEVDAPIDRAVSSFLIEDTGPSTCFAFNGLVSDFIRYLYKTGLRLPLCLSGLKAFAEAVFFLDTGYQNENTWGYEGAALDAIGTNDSGIELVLSRLAEIIKAVEREKYINWVFANHFSHLDWEARERIVAVYLKRNEEVLPAELLDLDPARLVNHLRSMITDHISTENTVDQVLSGERYLNSDQ